MKLTKPLIFFDLETAGVDTENDRICQLAFTKIYPNGDRESKQRIINPTIPIPKEASDVHHITDEVVKDCPVFAKLAKALFNIFNGCDIAGYNSDRFDIPLLYNEFARCGLEWNVKDAQRIDVFTFYKKLNPNDLSSVYHRVTGKILTNAHDAGADIEATIEVFDALVDKSEGIFETVEDVTAFTSDGREMFDLACKFYVEDGVIKWSFGKFKDQDVNVDRSYLDWFMKQPSSPSETKKRVLDAIVNGLIK